MRKLLFIAIAVLLFITQLLAQNRTITGKVTGDDGLPIPNASILIKGSSTGTTTQSDGSFTISVPPGARALIVSAIGLTSQELAINASTTTLSVSLKNENKSLEEVVVIAYGVQKKEALTGSVGIIKADQIARRPVNNVTTAIEGLVPGVTTTSANGQPGSGLSIRVRGFGSINATSEPLLVVDGVPYVGGTSNINPDDVESMTVLKDAASTALYGSRAANGVLIITTKKGKKGQNGISVRAMQGFATRGLPEYDRLDPFQYYPIMWEAYRNSLVYPASGAAISLDSANRVASGLTTRTHIHGLLSYNPFNVPNNAIVGVDGKINPNAQLIYADDLDWTKELLRRGPRSDYSVNFNGGSERSDYFLSVGYLKESGYTLKTDLKRYSARLNVNVQPKTWLKTGLNMSGNYSLSNTAQDGSSTGFVNPFFFTRNIGPVYPVYAHNMTTGQYLIDPATGEKFWDLGNLGSSGLGLSNRPSGAFGGRHALAETTLDEELFKRTSASARNYVDITFLKDFKFTNNLAVDYQIQNNNSYDNTVVGDGAPAGRSQKTSITNLAFIASQLLNYGKTLNQHRIDVLLGHESFNQSNTNVNGFKQGQTVSGNVELGNFTTINSTGSTVDEYKIESFFSRLNYDFDGKYFVSGSVRRDGNSRFSSESRWGTFWSVGAGWNISKSKFLNTVEWIDQLKLRSSYGVVGVADDIGFYAYQGLYGFSNNANEPGIVQSQTQTLSNTNLTWEQNKQFDIGVDFNLLHGRLSGSIEYFERTSADLLFDVPQPLSSGVLTITQNTATMKNKGVELLLSADIIRSKSFIWNTTINLSTLTNEITKMPEAVPEFITGTKKYSEGQSVFEYWLRSYYGVDPADGAALYVAANTAASANRRIVNNKSGGSDTLTILASNGKFEYQGTAIPDLYGSFGQSFTYKDFTLSALFTFQLGGKTFDANYQGLMSSGTYGGALSTDILKRWQKPGDITNVPRMDAGRTTDFNATSSRWLVDASYLNIRTISLAYSLPKSLISRLNISNAQFFISAENVAFFSERTGLNNQQAFSGVTSNAYPPARVVTAGLSLNL